MNNNKPTTDKKTSFWSTIPGILTTISGFIVAITGLLSALGITDLLGKSTEPQTPLLTATTEISTNTQTPLPEPTQVLTETAIPTATTEIILPTETPAATAILVHNTIPENPDNPLWFIDSSSLVYANEGQATADDFLSLLLERPFTAQSMEYVAHLDINRVEISESRNFIYISIFVENSPPQDAVVSYGVELDTDQDGRGDFLVFGLVPQSTQWTVAGVQVFADQDDNVGGPSPIKANDGISGNGYETLIFDSGYANPDPDLAWIRRAPNSGNQIQLAFKLSLIDYKNKFLWSAWADGNPIQPDKFDYNDTYTAEEAGSPIRVAPEYPLKGLALVDNTCRFPFGFVPTGSEPGLCP